MGQAQLIKTLIQPDGWIYNPRVSITQLRTRMRSELFMSMAMGIEVLSDAQMLTQNRDQLLGTLSDAHRTEYLSAEYFRSIALQIIDGLAQVPIGLYCVIQDCKAGQGYSDFAVKNKVDDYMGTTKRTNRDVALHSPISSVHAYHLSQYTTVEERNLIIEQLSLFAAHLKKEPFDIPAFKIRDLAIPFGTDISPLEIICAAWIRQTF